MAEVLTDLWGTSFELTDEAHKNRARDDFRKVDFKARHYNSFWEVAEETAMSRFYGGIHTEQDNNVGLAQGKRIGANVNALPWRKECFPYPGHPEPSYLKALLSCCPCHPYQTWAEADRLEVGFILGL